EVILLDFSLRTFTPVVVAAVIANVTTKAIYDGLARPEAEAVSHYGAIFGEVRLDATIDVLLDWPQLGNYLLLGVVCGVLAMGFTRAMLGGERVFGRLAWLGVFRPAVGGLGVGVLGVTLLMLAGGKFFPVDVYPMPAFFGDGYGAIQTLLGDMFYDDASFVATLTILGALLGAKLLATCLTLCSGGSGGVIAPSLFLGATAGGIVGLLLRSTELFRDIRPELYALVGMGATLAAVVHAPLASILILTELTGDYRVVLPAMLACVTATGFARLLFADSIYTHLLHKRGIRRGVGRDLSRLRRMAVEQVGLEPASVVSIGESMTDVVELMTRLDTSHFVVLDEKGMYAGVLLGEDLNTALLERDALPLLTAEELMRRDIQPLLHTDDLGTAFERFVFQDTDRLPVAHADTPGKVIGVLTRAGLMREYQRDDG
ncbi:MAG: chloride channel protein, partial [Planctomycetota bacterium]